MNQIRGVLFDYGLVLTGPPHPPAWERMKQVLGAEEAAFHSAYWGPRHGYDRGDIGGRQYWQTVAASVGRQVDEGGLRSLIEADTELWTQPNQAMIDWALRLQEAGVPTGILSNLGDEMELGVTARCGWLEGFGHRTFSHRLKIAKPEPEIYRHAAEGMGLQPGEILFIDDREDNIHAARGAGMVAVRYTGHDDFVAQMHALGLGALLLSDAAV